MDTDTPGHIPGRVHHMETDRATGNTRLARITPERWYFQKGEPDVVATADGTLYGSSGKVFDPADDTPYLQGIRAQVAERPVRAAGQEGPDVVTSCPHCRIALNTAQLSDHLLQHIRDLTPVAEAAPVESAQRRSKAA